MDLTVNERLASLEADNAELRAKVAALESMQRRKILPQPKVTERSVTVTSPVSFRTDDLPDDAELRDLRKICHRESGMDRLLGLRFRRAPRPGP